MITRTASCSCGQLSVTTLGEPVRISVCHCLECQKRTGSAFAAAARFSEDAVSVTGRSTTFRRTSDDGNTVSFEFCPVCGSTVVYRVDADPGTVAVTLGAFADPGFPPPTVSVYEEQRKHPWVGLPDDWDHWD